MEREIVLILNNIRSTHNVGAMFRTADAIGVSKIYLTGITPAPVDRFGRKRNDIAKTALGAEETIEWEYKENTQEVIDDLKQQGHFLIALEQSKQSVDYKQVKPKEKTAIIAGGEVGGISEDILGECDIVAEIPMKGQKESLNVTTALGIALFRILGI